jgi:predicted CXXCH cytochrome family protein
MKYLFLVIVTMVTFANDCLQCHANKEAQCQKNIHFTLQKEISLTLKAWGVKDFNHTLQTLPAIDTTKKITEPKDLAIDFLRRKCLRCHLTSKEINPTNNKCLACHNPHSNSFDSFKAKASQKKCLKCHNANFIGTDYLGMFPKDFDESYRAPLQRDGSYPKRLGGIDYHHLLSDIHAQKGLTCIDCHKPKQDFKASCLDCHSPSKKNHPSYHNNISCVACHSAWQTNSYKTILLRSDVPNYKDFERLIVSEDIYLENFLKKALQNPTMPPLMPDFLSNKLYKGLWYKGYAFRRWENFFLANYQGKIELARPLLDFELTYVNDKNQTIIDAQKFGGFIITKPHTITKEAKSCKMCHENPLNLNQKDTINYNLLKGKLLQGKPLNKEQIQRLISKKYKFLRAKEMFK